MSGHTPGPWVWLGQPGKSTLNAAHGEVLNYTGYENLTPATYDAATDLANMRLIAAAPTMLEALHEILAINSEDRGTFRKRGGTRAGLSIVAAEAAIAAATGKPS